MKLLGKFGQLEDVEQLWRELVELEHVNLIEAQARIDAAADMGDIHGAKAVLSYMVNKSTEVDVVHFTSAIRACANAKDASRAKEAQKMFDQMVAKGIEPNIVTYTNLLRAFRSESSQCCLHLLEDMKHQKHVNVNPVFAENFLFIFLKGFEKPSWRKRQNIAADLRKMKVSDLHEAKKFIDELRDSNVRLSGACKNIDAAIQMVLTSLQSS